MLQKNNRLIRKKEFDDVVKNGYSSYDVVLGIKAIKN